MTEGQRIQWNLIYLKSSSVLSA